MEKALVIKNLKKTYPNGPEALKGVNLEVDDGDFFALLGPNGAGKSTTIGILTGLVNKSAGTVSVYGHDLDEELSKVKASLGVVPQEFNFNLFETVMNTVLFQAGYYGIPRKVAAERAERLLKSLGLWEKREEPGRNLSGGMKRRLMLARALVNQPRLLILDEPTAGLDIELRRELWDFLLELNQKGTTIILTTHYLEEAEKLCRHIAIIDEGSLLTSEPIGSFLRKLESQVFVFELLEPRQAAPDLGQGMPCCLPTPTRLDVRVHKGTTLNEVFERLNTAGVVVEGMRNKSNRIEELFIDLVQNKKGEER
ncbi:MAG: ABC transporter ATP-binding protein [Vulcanimicrobiota bacterium]